MLWELTLREHEEDMNSHSEAESAENKVSSPSVTEISCELFQPRGKGSNSSKRRTGCCGKQEEYKMRVQS